jgi:enoyl-CoA hydratase
MELTGQGDVMFRKDGTLGRITLNRPKALNALTHEMCVALRSQVEAWASDANIHAVLIDAVPGRAFCAGGDVRALYDSVKRGDGSAAAFFANEYRLNAAIHSYPKPYVALVDGFDFGGGMGISMHGSHRILSENALAAMPETAIGLFPDIGASWFLNRCPGELGMYLALTSARIRAADLLYTRLATHTVPASRFSEISPRLAQGEHPDAVLASLAAAPGEPPLAAHRAAIDRAFAASTLEGVIDALQREGEWGARTAAHLATLSPTSLRVTFRQMREGRTLDFVSCMRLEYRLATRMAESHDFSEGVRAAVIDKDQKPRWNPKELWQICDNDISAYFAPLGPNELAL